MTNKFDCKHSEYIKTDNDNLVLIRVNKPTQYQDYFAIRNEVFVKEMHIPYEEEFIESEEEKSFSYLISLNDIYIGTIRYMVHDESIQIGRFTIKKEYRHQGHGINAVKALGNYLVNSYSDKIIYLNSMEYIASLYEKAGFERIGDIFLEVEIPHIKMIFKKK